MKYRMGVIDVGFYVVEAKDVEQAVKNINKLARKPAEHLTKEDLANRLRFHFEWQEFPEHDVIKVRDNVLTAFLQLMQKLPYDKNQIVEVQSKLVGLDGKPIIAPPGALVQTEQTKNDDHENGG